MEKALAGHNHLTKQEIDNIFKEGGLETNERLSNRFLIHAEAEGLICSGADKNNKLTFALLEERVPPIQELHKEEALAILARKYFRSHSPASLKDFVSPGMLPEQSDSLQSHAAVLLRGFHQIQEHLYFHSCS